MCTWGTYLSMHLSRRTTRPSIIVTFAARDTSLEMYYPSRPAIRPSKCNIHRGARYDPRNGTSSYHKHVSNTMQMTCSNENEKITILITKHNSQPGIQHQQISNKSPNHSQHHTRKYTNFIRLTRV